MWIRIHLGSWIRIPNAELDPVVYKEGKTEFDQAFRRKLYFFLRAFFPNGSLSLGLGSGLKIR